MTKYIIILLLTIWFTFLIPPKVYADVVLISPINTMVETSTREILFEWEKVKDDREYVYQLEVGPSALSTDSWMARIGMGNLTDTSYLYKVPIDWGNDIMWWVKYCLPVEGCNKTYSSTISSFSLSTPTVVVEEVKEVEPVVTVIERKYVTEPVEYTEEAFTWKVGTQGTVLGVSDVAECNFKYVTTKKKASLVSCNIPSPVFSEKYIYADDNAWRIYAKSSFTYHLVAQIDLYRCKRTINPKTWFSCTEEFAGSKYVDIYPGIWVKLHNVDGDIQFQKYSNEGKKFYFTSKSFSNTQNARAIVEYRIVEDQYDLNFNQSYPFDITEVRGYVSEYKPFGFPLSKYIGVTQWHGFTDFQSPHTGIDFGSTKEQVIAVSDGQVVTKGWDNFNGECMSGGNYLVIKQSNGMYTAYFHLQESYVNMGNFVSKGTVVGVSGNTGSWNCQPLRYHLHFETRKQRSQDTHVNPVEYINVDWSKVLTLGASSIPGRLSGENPHPSY